MQAIGNALTILGILVTFIAYFRKDSGVSLRDLEPGLTARWNQTRGWVRRRLGRTHTVTVSMGTAWDISAAITANAMVWNPIQDGDDLAVRSDKLARNLDALRTNVAEEREFDRQRAREVADKLSKQFTVLEQSVATHQEQERQESTAAMRWEVRGLLITLVGAGLSILG